MDKREETLKEALLKNDVETKRWEAYQKDVQNALENLDSFSTKLSVEVMVPIGSKAFMPGIVYHTNEVFVSHFAGMFSNCSVDQARTVCKHRLEVAKERLKQLGEEYDLFLNKLELPKVGALSAEGEHEIIEEYDEEKEELWRIEHRRKMQEYKQEERRREQALRNSDNKTDEEIMNALDELELMEELEQELGELQIEDDDTLQKLMSGEIKLPPKKKRTSHSTEKSDVVIGNENAGEYSKDSKRSFSVVEEISNKYKDVNLPDSKLPTDFTNNNSIPNSDDFNNSDSDDSDDSSTGDIPEEVLQVEKDTEHLSKKRRIKVFKQKIKETENSLKILKLQNLADMEHKAYLLEVREYLMDYVEILKDEIDNEDSSSSSPEEEKIIKSKPRKEKSRKKKSISFAVEDKVQYIDKNATVDSMFSAEGNKDIIKLDPIFNPDVIQHSQISVIEDNNNQNSIRDIKTTILEKVEQNYSFASENQSQQDFNLIDKILNSEEQKGKTLYINFNHSEQKFQYPGYEEGKHVESSNIIGSPADIYKMFTTEIISELPKQSPPEKFTSHEDAYEDVRNKFLTPNKSEDKENSSPLSDQSLANGNVKSILKNKDAVKQEARAKETQQKKVKKKKVQDDYCDFNSIMGEVVENPITEPEPLPTEKFVDAHAPKKRISRFKQMRTTQ